MATPSCSPCPNCNGSGGGALDTTSCIITILTFAYAVAAGLYFFYGSAHTSPQEMARVLQSLMNTSCEVQTLVSEFREAETTVDDSRGRDLQANVHRSAEHARVELEGALSLARSFLEGPEKIQRWRNRGRYVLVQEELKKKMADQETAMQEFRRAKERSVVLLLIELLTLSLTNSRCQLRQVRG